MTLASEYVQQRLRCATRSEPCTEELQLINFWRSILVKQRLKKDDQKVKVDERFKGMFNDDRFKLNCMFVHRITKPGLQCSLCLRRLLTYFWCPSDTVDKYGRKVGKSTADDMEKFYALDGEDEEEVCRCAAWATRLYYMC